MLNGNPWGLGETIYCPISIEKYKGGAIKEVSSAKNSINWCTLPESTNEYLVKANSGNDILVLVSFFCR